MIAFPSSAYALSKTLSGIYVRLNKNASEEEYSSIEGCALYDSISASVNLNSLNTLESFYNPYTYVEGHTKYYKEPKRDTFAHEFGHVSTYYYLSLKGDDSYEEVYELYDSYINN